MENDDIPVSHTKQNTVRDGGVCVYEKQSSAPSPRSDEHELLKFDRQEISVKRITITHDGVDDICSKETTIDGKRTLRSY